MMMRVWTTSICCDGTTLYAGLICKEVKAFLTIMDVSYWTEEEKNEFTVFCDTE